MRVGKNGARAEQVKIVIISLVLAVIAWAAIMWVDNPDITTTLSDLDVRFIGEAELRANGFVITGKDDIPVMSASISGKRSDLMDYMDRVRIEVDASQITEEGEYTLPGSLFLPSSRLSVEKEKYGDVPITVEKLTEKEIEVRVKKTGTLKNSVVQSVIDNPKITISGAKSEVDAVAYGLATVDISKIKEDGAEQSGYVLMNENDEPIAKNETIETQIPAVSVYHTVYELKNLPVEAELSPETAKSYSMYNAVISPSRIDVGVLGGNNDASIRAVVTNTGENGETEAELKATEGMYIPEESRIVKVRAEFKKVEAKPVELNIMAENAPEGKSVQIERVTVTITGDEDKLNTDNIKASVDLNGVGDGTHSLKVKIEGEGITAPDNCYTNVTIE